jgi:hypothetical protein
MTNDIIRDAFIQEAQERCEIYYNRAAKHRFSLGYIINRRKIIKDYEKSMEKRNRSDGKPLKLKPVFRLNLIIIAVLLAVLASTAFAIYTIINGFSFHTHLTHSIVEYLDVGDGKTLIEEEYYIPETADLTIVDMEKMSNLILIEYRYYDEIIEFSQQTTDYLFNINTEKSIVEEISINGNKGFYVKMNEESFICWVQYGYIFSLVGNIDKTNAVNLASCTKIK